MTILEAMAALRQQYPTGALCVSCDVWSHRHAGEFQIKFEIWADGRHFESDNLIASVNQAIAAGRKGTISDADAFEAEATQLTTQQPA